MTKNIHKVKKVVRDALDGKIINDTHALKISNIEAYAEKNGMKIIKILSVILLISLVSNITYAYDASYMTKLDLSVNTNVYILIGIIIFAIMLILVGIWTGIYNILLVGCITLFFVGLILILNGFNTVLSILMIVVPLILVWIFGVE